MFLEICNKTVLQQIEIKKENYTDEIDNNYEDKVNESFQLFEYNADKEIFPFMYKYKFIQFNDTIHVPLNDSQKFKVTTNGYIINLNCGINKELLSWIFMLHTNAKIIKPEKLKQVYCRYLMDLKNIYF